MRTEPCRAVHVGAGIATVGVVGCSANGLRACWMFNFTRLRYLRTMHSPADISNVCPVLLDQLRISSLVGSRDNCANRSDNEGSVVDRLSTCMTIGWLISSHWMRCAELCQDDVHQLADTSSLLCFPEKKQRPIPFYMILGRIRQSVSRVPLTLCRSVSGCIHRAESRRKGA